MATFLYSFGFIIWPMCYH